ncbi:MULTISPECIES: UbiD family decarboxylase [Rhodoplanes]|jgi:UbiD family decarboxylase|nr:UbiD family decarboxylase [Rhodoplanes serenus]VCU06781.1 Phenolic acid decarboxylase subunit C [Rhodoplanes serenus]
MPSLADFLDTLPASDKLVVSTPTELDYLPTALVLELEAQKRFPAVVIERPDGYDVPVVTNLFADRDRIARMVGVGPGEFARAWTEAMAKLVPAEVTRARAPVQEVVALGHEADAGALPISRHFEADAGRYIGSGILICKDPDTGVRNLSFQRMQLKGPQKFGVSLHSRGHIWDHLQRSEARGRNLEVAVVIGCHPAIYIAAAAKVAMEIDELAIAGALLKRPVELVKCRTIDVEVPADAEYVIEGEILAGTHEDEGPYGEYTGYSTYRSTRNVFHVKAITRRAKPIFLDIVPGYSSEHLLLSRCTREAHVFHRLKEMVPTLTALNYPKSGTHFHAYMSFRKTAEGQARQALMLLMGLDSYIKLAVAVDDDIDVFDEDEVMWALATRFQADTDLFMVPKVFCNRLDPSSVDGMSAKLALDATKPLKFEGERTRLPQQALDWAREIASRRPR